MVETDIPSADEATVPMAMKIKLAGLQGRVSRCGASPWSPNEVDRPMRGLNEWI